MSTPIVNLIANDTDPDNDLPLTLTAVDPRSGPVSATIVSSTSVQLGTTGTGTFTFHYTVTDSLGASNVGQLFVTVTSAVSCTG